MKLTKAFAAATLPLVTLMLTGCPPTKTTPQESFWTSYIEACSPTAQLNGDAVFLGTSNNIGPGSTWGTAGGTANLDALPQAFLGPPNATGQFTGVNYPTSPTICASGGTKEWDLSLGLPISFGDNDLSAALTASNTKTITVGISGVEIDTVPATTFEDALNKLDKTSSEFTDATDGNHYLMSAADAVTGLTIKYTLNSALSASAKANIQSKVVTVGTSQNPAQVQIDIDTTGQVVTLSTPPGSKFYVLGQFLKIKPVTATTADNKTVKQGKVESLPQ